MAKIPEAVKRRLKKHIGKAQVEIKNIINEHKKDGNEELLRVFKYIASNIFGFNEQKELINLSIIGLANYCLGVKIENEIKYFIEITSPKENMQNENLSKTIEYAMTKHIEWFVKTNGTLWDIYRSRCKQPNEYGKVCSINFFKLNPNDDEDMVKLLTLCKESHNKPIITDLHNRYRWYGYLNENRTSIDYMFLVNVCLYEDGSEKVHIPLLDVTFWCDEPFIGRQNAERAIEKFLRDEYGKEFNSRQQFQSTAYHRESIYIKKDVPVWW